MERMRVTVAMPMPTGEHAFSSNCFIVEHFWHFVGRMTDKVFRFGAIVVSEAGP